MLDKTVSWREEVVLRSGKSLLVDRSVTYGPDEWFRPGRGPMKALTLSFDFQGRKVKWHSDDAAVAAREPAILDVVEGAPLLVVPVSGWQACHRFGFPREAFVAWREERGRWVRADAQGVPADLNVNLARSFRDLLREPPARGLVVNATWKTQLDAGRSGPKQGEALAAISRYYGDEERSCKRMRPSPDPAADAALQRVAQVERAARTIAAQRTSLSMAPEAVTRDDFRAAMGVWKEVAWVSEGCRPFIQRVEPRHQYSGDDRSSMMRLTGYTIHLAATAAEPRILLDGSNPGLAVIACDEAALIVVRRGSPDRLLIDRFEHSGRMIDATWLQVPDAMAVSADGKTWPSLWKLAILGPRITITLADYAYERTMGEGGTLRRKATYEALLGDGSASR